MGLPDPLPATSPPSEAAEQPRRRRTTLHGAIMRGLRFCLGVVIGAVAGAGAGGTIGLSVGLTMPLGAGLGGLSAAIAMCTGFGGSAEDVVDNVATAEEAGSLV